MTREVLGGLVGKSAEWVKAVENGRLQQPKLYMLLRLAEALRIRELSELAGDQSVPVRIFTGPGHPALPAVRAAINTLAWDDGPAEPLGHLQARLDAAWRARHASPDHRTVLGAILPGLIRDAQRAVNSYQGDDRRRAHAVLAETYNLAQFFLAYQPAADLLWRVADRAMGTARDADEPYAIGASVWLLAQAHESRQGGESRRQARRTADLPIPSQPRRGRHLIEVARGYHLANDLGAALGTLDSAYKTAPETIRYNGYARKILFELATEGPAELRRDANGLADRVGMLV